MEAALIDSQTAAQRLAQSLMAANMQLQLQIQASENNIRILQAGREGLRSDGRRKLVDARLESERQKIETLRSRLTPPERIGGLPVMQRAIIHLTNHRNELTICLLEIHDLRPKLRDAYEDLAGDERIKSALRQLGFAHQLGSGEDYDSEPFLRKLAGYEKHVFTDDLPLYRSGEELRVAAFIHRTPVTFTWHNSEDPTMLTASVIEAAGLTVPDDAPQMRHRFSDGQTLTVRQFEIPYLRFGRHVLKDISAFALPAEGERYGAQIGPAGFENHSPRAEPEKMRLVIR
jgi:hypothetical protein